MRTRYSPELVVSFQNGAPPTTAAVIETLRAAGVELVVPKADLAHHDGALIVSVRVRSLAFVHPKGWGELAREERMTLNSAPGGPWSFVRVSKESNAALWLLAVAACAAGKGELHAVVADARFTGSFADIFKAASTFDTHGKKLEAPFVTGLILWGRRTDHQPAPTKAQSDVAGAEERLALFLEAPDEVGAARHLGDGQVTQVVTDSELLMGHQRYPKAVEALQQLLRDAEAIAPNSSEVAKVAPVLGRALRLGGQEDELERLLKKLKKQLEPKVLETLSRELEGLGSRGPGSAQAEERYQHEKLGIGVLVGRSDGNLRLRFEDGVVRTLKPSPALKRVE